MNNTRREPLPELEALIRAAGNYVRPSDDLRPRILETARSEVAERRTLGRFKCWLIAVAAVLLLLWSLPNGWSQRQADIAPAARLQHHDNPAWDAVDAFAAIRRRLAELWESAL